MDSIEALLTQTGWSELDHACGPAFDAPFQLLALLGDDIQARSAAATYLDIAILHQDSICSATAPVARVIAAMLDDPRTMAPVANVLPWDPAPRPLRLDLVGFLDRVAGACLFDVEEDATLVAQAYPAGRDEAELQRLQLAQSAWLRDITGNDPFPPEDDTPPSFDPEFRRAMRARLILACRALAPDLLAALTPLFDDPDDRIKLKALEAAVRLSGHSELTGSRPAIADRIEASALASADPRGRAAAARLLAMLEADPRSLLFDDDPGVRACAALAPALADDPRATRAILDALLTPHEVDHWFEGHLPGQEGWLRFDLIWAAVERTNNFEDLLPPALAILPLAGIHTLDKDLGPFLTAAFPRPFRDGDTLSAAQRAYVSALLAEEALWRGASSRPWFRRTGLPLDRDDCLALC